MLSGKDWAIREMMKSCREALSSAKLFRKIAAKQATADQAAEYRRQARFEIDKARGYLRQADFLRKTEIEEDRVA